MGSGDWDSYVLVLRLSGVLRVEAGLVRAVLDPGVYFYIGSAKGPGGAWARVIRHLSKVKRARWHVDYLTASPLARVEGFLLVKSVCKDFEVEASNAFSRLMSYVPRFGSTDKQQSPSHLFKCGEETLEECLVLAGALLEQLGCVEDFLAVLCENSKAY
ncbi:MAG: GIY-YIG nuclease family protein [Desulfurococcaceae archaeon]